MSGSPIKRNLAVVLGPVLALFGFLSYFTLFVRWPALRDGAWLNVGLVVAGSLLALAGTWQTMRLGRSLIGKLASLLGVTISLLATTLLLAYVFVWSNQLPAPVAASLALQEAPDFTLAAHDGETVRLSELRGRRVLLVFYRGYW